MDFTNNNMVNNESKEKDNLGVLEIRLKRNDWDGVVIEERMI